MGTGTDLFGKYFNNPSKAYVYGGPSCNGPSADEVSFGVSGSFGEITDNQQRLAAVDLAGLQVPVLEYSQGMRTIDPYGFVYVRGFSTGESYTRKEFGLVGPKSLEIEDWEYRTTLIFHIKFVDKAGMKLAKCCVASGNLDEEIPFWESAEKVLESVGIPVRIGYKEGYIWMESTELGYDFWVTHMELVHYLGDGNIEEDFPELFDSRPEVDEPGDGQGFGIDDGWTASKINYFENSTAPSLNAFRTHFDEGFYRAVYDVLGREFIKDSSESEGDVLNDSEFREIDSPKLFNVYLFEDLTRYVPYRKYINGAMRGVLVSTEYPSGFDFDSVENRGLRAGYLRNRIEDFYTSPYNAWSGLPMYVRVVRDVRDSYYSEYEYDVFKKWSNGYSVVNKKDAWIEPHELPTVSFDEHDREDWTHSHVPNSFMLNTIYKDENLYGAVGLHGYCTWLEKHGLWESFGDCLMKTCIQDSPDSVCAAMIPSFLIYNPNSFPVKVRWIAFI